LEAEEDEDEEDDDEEERVDPCSGITNNQ